MSNIADARQETTAPGERADSAVGLEALVSHGFTSYRGVSKFGKIAHCQAPVDYKSLDLPTELLNGPRGEELRIISRPGKEARVVARDGSGLNMKLRDFLLEHPLWREAASTLPSGPLQLDAVTQLSTGEVILRFAGGFALTGQTDITLPMSTDLSVSNAAENSTTVENVAPRKGDTTGRTVTIAATVAAITAVGASALFQKWQNPLNVTTASLNSVPEVSDEDNSADVQALDTPTLANTEENIATIDIQPEQRDDNNTFAATEMLSLPLDSAEIIGPVLTQTPLVLSTTPAPLTSTITLPPHSELTQTTPTSDGLTPTTTPPVDNVFSLHELLAAEIPAPIEKASLRSLLDAEDTEPFEAYLARTIAEQRDASTTKKPSLHTLLREEVPVDEERRASRDQEN